MALKLNDRYLNSFVAEHELTGIAPAVKAAHDQLVNRNGLGSDFLGWIDLPVDYDKEEFARIKQAAAKIKKDRRFLPRRKSSYRGYQVLPLQQPEEGHTRHLLHRQLHQPDIPQRSSFPR